MKTSTIPGPPVDVPATPEPQSLVLAGGCFWCVEAVYRLVRGVREVVSGYAGGASDTANYCAVELLDICGGNIMLLPVIVENGRAILRADIIALPIQFSGIMGDGKKDFQ